MRLRGQVGVLRNELSSLRAKESSAQKTSETGIDSLEKTEPVALADLQDVGAATPHQAIETLLWATREKRHDRLSELLDFEMIRNRAFAELRSAYPKMGVREAENLADEFVSKAKQQMDAGDVVTRTSLYDQVKSVRIEDISFPHEDQERALVQVAMTLQNGQTETDSLKLRKYGDKWLITPPEERSSLSVKKMEDSPNP